MKKKGIIISCIILIVLIAVGCFLILGKGKKIETPKKLDPVINEITISFETDGGSTVESIKIKQGATIEIPTTIKEGFSFLGWFNNGEKIDENTKFDSDTTLTAKWEKISEEAKTYTVTFDSKGGSSVSKMTVECGKVLYLPKSPTKKGYTFVNWKDKNGKVISSGANLSCEDITLYASWKEEKTSTTPSTEPVKQYSCPSGYTLNGTKCTTTKDAVDGCDKQTQGKYNGKCYVINSYKAGECKVMTGSSSPGYPILESGTVIKNGNDFYCVKDSTASSECTNSPEKKVNGTCYKYVQNNGASFNPCSTGYDYIIGNALYDTSIGRTNVKSGCYSSVALHKICESDYTLINSKCTKTIDATVK